MLAIPEQEVTMKMMCMACVAGAVMTVTSLAWATEPRSSSAMVPAQGGSCPSGASYAGSGYCKSGDGKHFMPAVNGSCPSGSAYASAGYCRANKVGVSFVPAVKGSCPSGSAYASSGYCRIGG